VVKEGDLIVLTIASRSASRRHQYDEDRQSRSIARHDPRQPAARGFTLVDVERLPWKRPPYPGVETKSLLVDRATGVMTLLMKMAPGARCRTTSM